MSTPLDIRIVTFRDGSLFVAQALEVDISAQGRTADEAVANLHATLREEDRAARQAGRSLLDIGPAPHPFHVLCAGTEIERLTTKVA